LPFKIGEGVDDFRSFNGTIALADRDSIQHPLRLEVPTGDLDCALTEFLLPHARTHGATDGRCRMYQLEQRITAEF
jgi:hypothetical protein